jgi:hypothetical protein
VAFHRTGSERHSVPFAEDEGWYEGVNVAFTFEGASPSPVVETRDELPGRYHFFIDNDPAGWHRNVRSYARVIYRDVYPGIDVEYYEKDGHLEYDLVLRPGADPTVIQLRCAGADGLSLTGDGSLRIATGLGDILHTAPVVAAGGRSRLGSSRIALAAGDRIDFTIEQWDGLSTLRVDPALVYGTFLGTLGSFDSLRDIVVDGSGQVVVCGTSISGYPTTPGAFQETYAGGSGDGVITKLAADGTTLLFSTYLGTSDFPEAASRMALSRADELFVSGATGSAMFPVTPDAFDSTHNGSSDMWFVRMAADGSNLLYSTYFGGSGFDKSANIAVGPAGDIYLAGSTESPDFPTTEGAYSTTLSANGDAYIMRLDGTSCAVVFSTLGGTAGVPVQQTAAQQLAVDKRDNVYVTGVSSGTGLPVTTGAFAMTHSGEGDAFVLKVDASGSFLHYCTYFGGTRWEDGRGIHVDETGAAYLMGMTDSLNLPVTPNAYSKTKLGTDCAYVAKLSPDGSSVEYCTYVGSSCFDDPYAFAVDSAGFAYVGGHTCQTLPTTPDAIKQGISGLPNDGFLVTLDPTGSSVVYATLIGGDTPVGAGSASETVRTMTLDGRGGVYLAGETASIDFPVTAGAYDTQMAGAKDGFVVKIDFGPWTNVGHSLAGTGGTKPFLSGDGSLETGSSGSVQLYNGKPFSPATLVVGLTSLLLPFKGGTMVPHPLLLIYVATDAAGELLLLWPTFPPGLPGGTELHMQYWIADVGGPVGLSASNGLQGTIP